MQLLADWLRMEVFRSVTLVHPTRYGSGPVIIFITAAEPDAYFYTVALPSKRAGRSLRGCGGPRQMLPSS